MTETITTAEARDALTPYYVDEHVTLHHGDCLDVLRTLPDCSIDAVVTDPPYGLRFMGRAWDGQDIIDATRARQGQAEMPDDGRSGVNGGYRSPSTEAGRYDLSANAAFGLWCQEWATECLRVLKPGGHMLAFGGSRTWHRLACAVEDAGFEIRDSIAWIYGKGFPKSVDVAKAIDKAAGHWRGRATAVESDNQSMGGGNYGRTPKGTPITPAAAAAGYGTALKPAFEPIVVGRKPLAGTVAANWIDHGTGALNIDACRVVMSPEDAAAINAKHAGMDPDRYERPAGVALNLSVNPMPLRPAQAHSLGRWPTNVLLEESQAAELDRQTGVTVRIGQPRGAAAGDGWGMTATGAEYSDAGGASRFFPVFRYESKANSAERPKVDGVAHPTVKPLDLMRWLVRLVTPPGGVVLDPFAGSGTTAEACVIEGFRCVLIEREAGYLPLIVSRLTKPIEPVLDFTREATA